jgi:hypothetical protein
MSQRTGRATGPDTTGPEPTKAAPAPAPKPAPAKRIGSGSAGAGLSQRIAAPQSLADAEARYVDCRDAWTAAMRAAASGRPADMATLAICQEEYEAAALERDRWLSGARVAIPVEPEAERAPIDVVVEQAMAWRDVHHHEKPRGVLGRLFGRRNRD